MISLTNDKKYKCISGRNGYNYFKINIYFPPEYLSYERVSASNCELLLINSHHAHWAINVVWKDAITIM